MKANHQTPQKKMVIPGCISIPKLSIIRASLPTNSPNPATPRKPSRIPAPKPTHNQQTQPSVSEIERAIGAGIFRDHDPASEIGENKGVFDALLKSVVGKTEGPTERALRETGEWIGGQTERAALSSRKRILEIMFLWMAPAWLLLFLVASGAVKLPFSSPALDNLLM